MSNDIALRVENVSKRYVVGELVSAADLKRWISKPLHRIGLGHNGRGYGGPDAQADHRTIRQRKIGRHEFWALKDINFEVKRGEVLGIIGANGAGKSTLLKVLSRITAPTTGRIDLYGRVASLLEVGTGFHPELTGRENIYLNGSILGMNKAEVDKKFDEIVEFAGTEEFIDTPIKRYSSGMRVRLGFAVAAHLEPEILIVDEVLAVGDASFQAKCLGKMRQTATSGRTVLFVSHAMSSIKQLCDRSLRFKQGQILEDGPSESVVANYLKDSGDSVTSSPERRWDPRELGSDGIYVRSLCIADLDGSPRLAFSADEPISVSVDYCQEREVRGLRVVMQFLTSEGEVAFTSTDQAHREASTSAPGTYRSTCHVPAHLFNRGRYHVRLIMGIPADGRPIVSPTIVNSIDVSFGLASGSAFADARSWPGAVCPWLEWDVTRVRNPEGAEVTL